MITETLIENPPMVTAASRVRTELSERAVSTAAITPARVALWVVLASVTMLFAGFASAYLVRRSASDWVPIYAPSILWWSTAALLASSLALEKTKAVQQKSTHSSFRAWILASVALGLAFVVGQITAWRDLSAMGIFLPTSPHSSFFYMLTGVHAAHVLGGVVLLLWLLGREWRAPRVTSGEALSLAATYWHFVTGIWIFLYLLLFAWR